MIKNLFGKMLIPFAYYIRGDRRFKYYKEYVKNLKLSHDEIIDLQNRKLRRLVKHAYETVPYYTKLFDDNGIDPESIRSIKDLKKIPPIDKVTAVKNIKGLTSTKKYKLTEFVTGGSTGNRMVVYKDKEYYERSRAVWLRDMYSVGVEPGDKVAWVWGSPYENKPLEEKWAHRLLWWTNRRIMFDVAKFGEAALLEWLTKDFMKFKPKFLYGYSNLVYEVAKCVDKHKLKLPQLQKVICSAESLEHRDYIEKVFGCPCIDQYGCREVFQIAIEDDDYNMRVADDFVIVEIDEKSRILLTPLDCYGMPLLRYVLGDIARKVEKADANYEKSPFSIINLKIGRTCELLKTSDGKVLSFANFCDIGEEKLSIKQWQIVQKSYDEVMLNIVKSDHMKDEDVKRLQKIVQDKLQAKKVIVEYYDTYPLEKSGKKLTLKCEIKE